MSEAISLRQLRYLRAVAQHGSFSAAAQALRISQPALGVQIKRLEQALGAPLLERHARGAKTTEAGKILVADVESILSILRSSLEKIESLRKSKTETVRLGVTVTAGRVLIPALLMERHARGRSLALQLVEGTAGNLLKRTRNGELDAALVYDIEDESGAAMPLFSEEFVLVGRSGMFPGGERIPFAGIAKYDLVLRPAIDPFRKILERRAREAGIMLRSRAEVGAVSLQPELIRNGLCVIVPYSAYIREVDTGEFSHVGFDPPLRRTMFLLPRSNLEPEARDFVTSAVKKAVEEKIAEGRLGWSPGRPLSGGAIDSVGRA